MIPSHIKFGWAINSWMWFICIILVILNKEYISKTVEYYEPWLQINLWFAPFIVILIITQILLELYTSHLWLKNKEKEEINDSSN